MVQDFTSTLNSHGEGPYGLGAWVRLATGTDTAYLIVQVVDSTGTHYFSSAGTSVNSTGYSQVLGQPYIYFVGTLSSATIYLQTSNTESMYVDDFSLTNANLIPNSGFESGASGWTALNSSISVTSTDPYRGAYSCYVSSRTVPSSSVSMNITSILSANGPGYYSYGVQVALASGADSGAVIISVTDSNGTHWYEGPFSDLTSNSFVPLYGLNYISWAGTLSSATIYFQTVSTLTALYADNFSLTRNYAMSPLGAGVSGNPITLGCYPASSCQTSYAGIITTGLASDCITLTDPSYWNISNLTLTGGTEGIRCHFDQLGNQNINIQNIYTYALVSKALIFDGYNACINPSGSTYWKNPTYCDATSISSGSYIYSNVNVVNFSAVGDGGQMAFMADYPNAQMISAGYPNAQQNVLVQNYTASGSNGCVLLANAENFTFMDSAVYEGDILGSCGTPNYNTSASNITWVNGTYSNSPDWSGSPDNAVFVFDNNESNLKWRGNFFRNNAASAIEGKENPNFQNNTVGTDSSFEMSSNGFSINSTLNYGPDTNDPYGYYGDIDSSYSPMTTGTIQNNLYYDSPQSYNAFAHNAPTSYWTFTGNYAATADADFYSAPYDFSSTQGGNQWSYQEWNGSSLVNLPTFSSNPYGEWSESGTAYAYGFIDAFDMAPDNNSSNGIVRTWTAPKTGTVNIVGWAVKSTLGGNNLRIGISTPSAWIWPNSSGWTSGTLTANDQVGFATNVDSVYVTSGSTISFWIGNTGNNNANLSVVSWAPMIAYTMGTLISQGASTTVSSNSPTGYGSNAVDGDNGTYWCASSGSFPQWIDVDLGSSQSLSQIQTIFYANETWYYKIEGSPNNSTWTTLADHTGSGINSQSQTDSVSGSYRYVRVTVTNASVDWAAIREIKIYH